MSEKDIVFSKINIIKNCIMAIEKATQIEKDKDFLVAIYELNLQRAIQACIDLANVIISHEGLGLPNTYRNSFEILAKHNVITSEMLKNLIGMVGFRNISVHDYGDINPEIVKGIVKDHLSDFSDFYTIIYERVTKKVLKNS